MDTDAALTALEEAAAQNKLTRDAAGNIRAWLTESRYAEYAPQVAEHIEKGDWETLNDVFWRVIPFGTGGRRGKMYPIGTNAINDRTIGESAQGVADYVAEDVAKELGEGAPLGCAIAYDTRHGSREFAGLCAEIMVARGFTVYFLDGYRSTPELSFAVRMKNCSCGIMVTASHNPPSDNAVKVYWSTGGQLLPPHDKNVIDRVMNVQDIRRAPFAQARADGKIVYCEEEVDAAYIEAAAAQRFEGPRDVKIIYSPLHGVGASAVMPLLEKDGFAGVELFGPHAEPDGDFPNVPEHVANPENPEVFDALIARARETGAELVMATDPDCDRIGCAAPKTSSADAPWGTLTGNQIAALLTEYVLAQRKKAGTLSPEHYIVKTLVTTPMMERIADAYGVKTFGNLLVGFKWIGGQMDAAGPDEFVFGGEESHGYLIGQYARDKDGAVAAMLLAELAAQVKAEGKSLHEQLDALYWQYGAHAERLINVMMPGAEGMDRMQSLMQSFREAPPESLAGMRIARVRDYKNLVTRRPNGGSEPLEGPRGDMVMLDLEAEGNFVAVRPSGTEPKVKFYLFAFQPAEQLADLEDAKRQLSEQFERVASDLKGFAGVG